MPIIEKSYCEETRAKVQWKSSFNGGAIQLFTVIALNSQQQQIKSDNISDRGKNKIHFTYVQNLQPSTTYVFYVSAQNSHGLSSSEHISCTTKEGKYSISVYPLTDLIILKTSIYPLLTVCAERSGGAQRSEMAISTLKYM